MSQRVATYHGGMSHDRHSSRETLLRQLTSIPTATGREERVIRWVEEWVASRPALRLDRDESGNLHIARREARPSALNAGPIILEAHLDHPAFVVESVNSPTSVTAAFRGGVMAPYFEHAPVIHHGASRATRGRIVDSTAPDPNKSETAPGSPSARLFRMATIELETTTEVAPGDMLTWDLPESEIRDGLLHAPACDDLAAVAAALCAMDELLAAQSDGLDVRLLFTLAEEVGFVGAIAACKNGSIPPGARILALENSRSFADSPLGAGPIVRVGDRLSVFSPALTAAVAKIAQQLTGEDDKPVGQADKANKTRAAAPRAKEVAPVPGFNWQRKLMPGGACEATAFCAFGHEATCVCLPLRNYHNMGNLEAVEAATKAGEPVTMAKIMPEVIAISDFHNLVELLIACGRRLGAVEPMTSRLEKMFEERKFVLDPSSGRRGG